MANYNTGTTFDLVGTPHTTALTGTVPAGVLTGDVMIVSVMVFTFSGATAGFSTPASGGGNWTQIGTTLTSTFTGGFPCFAMCFYRVATAGDAGSTFSMSFTGTVGSTDQFWWSADLESYTGFYTASPIGNVFTVNNVNAGTITAPSGTTGRDNSWAIYTCQTGVSGSGNITGEPTTSRHVMNDGAGINTAISDSAGSAGNAGSAIGGGTWTLGGSSSSAGMGFTIELATQAAVSTTAQTTPPRIPHPLWYQLLEVAAARADWQAQGVASLVPQHYRLMDGYSGRPGVGSTGTQPPASGTNNASALVNGLTFYVTAGGMWFEGYWYYVCASGQSTAPASFALWSAKINASSGAVVPGTTVTSGTLTAGQWNYVPLPQPVQLSIWGVYTAAVGVPAGAGFPDTANQWGAGNPYSGGVSSGPLTAFSDATGTNPVVGGGFTQFCFNSGGSDPAAFQPVGGSVTHDMIWLDVQVSNTPPPGYSGSTRFWPNMFDADWVTTADAPVSYTIGTKFIITPRQGPQVVNAIWYYVADGQGSSGNQWATSADIWRVSDQVRVATQPNPVWTKLWTGGVDGQSNSGRWVCTQLPGTVTLQPGEYAVTVYNGNPTPNGWGAKRLQYWQAGSGQAPGPNGTFQYTPPGVNGIQTVSAYAPTTPAASDSIDYINSATEPGQSVFAVGPPNAFPALYVGNPGQNIFQNYWVDIELTPASLYQPDAPELPGRIPHPLMRQLAEIAAYRFDGGPQPIPPVTRTAALSGTGSLILAIGLAAGLSGSGSLTGSPVFAETAALTGTGTLTASPVFAGTAAMSGSGTLTASAVFAALAALSGSGSLELRLGLAAALSGSGSLSALSQFPETAALSGAGTLTALSQFLATAVLSGIGSLSAPGRLLETAALSGSGLLSAYPYAALLSGSGILAAPVTTSEPAALSGSGLLAASSMLEAIGALSGIGTLGVSYGIGGNRSAALSGSGTLNSNYLGTLQGIAILRALPAMSAGGLVIAGVATQLADLWAAYVAAKAVAIQARQNWEMMRQAGGTDGTAGFLFAVFYDADQAADVAYDNWRKFQQVVYPGARG